MDRIALIFDTTHRPETTGVYVRRALGQLVQEGRLGEVEHFLPTELERAARGQFDLYLFVDDGLECDIPMTCRPAAWWAIDTHMSFERCLKKARSAQWTFAAQKDGAALLREHGIENALWLPLACDPELHSSPPREKTYDVAFVGNVFPGERQELLDQIRRRYANSFVGQRYFTEMAEVYAQSRIVFNRSIKNDINMRVFEALCSGSLLLTNDLSDNGQSELFQAGSHLATYSNADELFDRISYFLEHQDLRERIAAAGRVEVLARHTYQHRVETILSQITASQGSAPKSDLPVRPTLATKDQTYFEFDRPDVLELVPLTAKRVLDIGCGSGRLGAAIKSRQKAKVTGIEYIASAAAQAHERLDEVHIGNVEQEDFGIAEGAFDCVVCADVLEHLRSPEVVLRKIRRWLAPDGCLVTSLPNVRNHTVVHSLLAGNWTYESAGLLDADHVRFFTRRETEKLLYRTGFDVEDMRMVPGEGFGEWVKGGRSAEIAAGGLQIRASSPADAAEFFAYQYLTRSRPSLPQDHGLTSVILVTHNQLAYTRSCIDSIRLRTDEPIELICVDNASTDGTVEYLRSLPDVQLIVNDTNRGFPAAANQGIRAATGQNILLLNNDTIVTTGWLRRMLNVLHSEHEIGLVGPVSNRISGEQQIDVTYSQLNDLDGFAWDWGKEHGHELIAMDRLVGFCLLMKREVVDSVGLLDERFGVGNFEDDDFCRRAMAAGYKAVIARGAFVHHFGSATFRGSGIDLGRVLQDNQKIFDRKWSSVESAVAAELTSLPSGNDHQASTPARPRPEFVLRRGAEGGLLLEPNTIKLSVCLIVRDNETTIRPCLESIRPWVDEIIVVDTGSTDRTPAICEELGARVFHWAWRNDFAAARNVSLDHARGEWLFWMDSDDTIPKECGRKLRALADGNHAADILGYVMQVHCPGRDPSDITVVDHVKLIRNRPALRFEFRIHEQVLPSIRRAAGEVAFTDIYVVHSGSDHSPKSRSRKLKRDFHLLELELRDRPNHPFVLFNLGMTHADVEQHDKAISYLTRCIALSGPEESHVRKAYALLVSSLSKLKQSQRAWVACCRGLELFPTDKELLFRLAMLQHELGRLADSARTYRRILNERTDRHFTSVDRGIAGSKARHNLALVLEQQGELAAAETEWRVLLAHDPSNLAAVHALALLLRRPRSSIHAFDTGYDQDLPSQRPSSLTAEPEMVAAPWEGKACARPRIDRVGWTGPDQTEIKILRPSVDVCSRATSADLAAQV